MGVKNSFWPYLRKYKDLERLNTCICVCYPEFRVLLRRNPCRASSPKRRPRAKRPRAHRILLDGACGAGFSRGEKRGARGPWLRAESQTRRRDEKENEEKRDAETGADRYVNSELVDAVEDSEYAQ